MFPQPALATVQAGAPFAMGPGRLIPDPGWLARQPARYSKRTRRGKVETRMSSMEPIIDALDERTTAMLADCTQCGKCVEVCPMPAMAGPDDPSASEEPKAVIAGVLDSLRGGGGSAAALRWAAICSGTGHCIEACPEGLNPRFLLSMVRRASAKRGHPADRRAAGRQQFQKMSRGVKVLSRLQLAPELLERLSPSSHPERAAPPELVFYTGCNLLKTPHIGLLCLDILDRLSLSYEVYGGPSNCCGILPMRPGDDENAMRQGSRTIQRFNGTGASEVLSWCPTCQLQFGEVTLPVQSADAAPRFDMTMFPVFLARRLDALRPHLTRPVNLRVALHEHPGTEGVVEAVRALLGAVPGLELVELPVPKVGYSLTALAPVVDKTRGLLARELAEAETAGVDALVGIYHTEHRELAAHEGQWPFQFVNYLDLIGQSMGIEREDVFKRLKLMQDVDAILADCAETMQANDLSADEARDVVLAELLGDQILPLDRASHAAYLKP